jgi:hypothetical protein
MSKKDVDLYFTQKDFMDEPFYLLGKAYKIHRARKKHNQYRNRIQEDIQRLRLLKNSAQTEEEVLSLEVDLSYLKEERAIKFDKEFRKQIHGDDWAMKKSYKIERRLNVLVEVAKLIGKVLITIAETISKIKKT